jgi:hypothetical protein
MCIVVLWEKRKAIWEEYTDRSKGPRTPRVDRSNDANQWNVSVDDDGNEAS